MTFQPGPQIHMQIHFLMKAHILLGVLLCRKQVLFDHVISMLYRI
jgi:hypothetical protein